MKRILAVAVAALALGGLLAACDDDDNGDDSSDTTTTTEATEDTTTTTGGATGDAAVAVADTSLGEVLVDAEGRTLYLFEQDAGTEVSACTGSCAELWPPLTSDAAPTAGEGLDAALLGVAEQPDGSSQVTYNGHLLYTYAQDSAPGDTNGQGVGDVWFAVTPAGEAVSG